MAPTSFIDVTHDIRVAEWFAFNSLKISSTGLSSSSTLNGPFRSPAVFVLLALEGLTPVVDTMHLVTPDESLRPHRQACAVIGGAGNLYRNATSRFIAVKIKFADSFAPTGLPSAQWLFPGPDEDRTLEKLSEIQGPRREANKFPIYWFPSAEKPLSATV